MNFNKHAQKVHRMESEPLWFYAKELIILALCVFFFSHLQIWGEKLYMCELRRLNYDNDSPFHWRSLLYFFGLIPFYFSVTNYFFVTIFGAMIGVGSGSGSRAGNISRIKNYRDNILGTMSSEDASGEYSKTLWVDGLSSCNGKNAEKTRDYINSKLSSMSQDDGYNWLKSKS